MHQRSDPTPVSCSVVTSVLLGGKNRYHPAIPSEEINKRTTAMRLTIDLVRSQQTRTDECLQRLSHLLCLYGIGPLKLGTVRTTARGILFGHSRLDQAQKYITRRLAMRIGRQCLIGLLGMLRQCSFDTTHLMVGLQGQLVAVTSLKS
jgi:hypothetical protein